MFVRAPNPIWWIPDHTGVSLNDEYFAFFKTNTFPYLPQAVYQTPNGTPWSDPIRFQPSGTLPNNLYFDPSLTYRIEIRHGNTQADQLIWLIENFQSGGGGSLITQDTLLLAENMLTNPQFADIFFSSPHTFTAAGTYDIAPGWQLTMVGSGSVVVTQTSLPGTSGLTGNPTYFLDFASSGSWSSVYLTQTFHNNGAIFSGGAIAAAVTARSTTNPTIFSVVYVPSDSGTQKDIISNQVVPTGAFISYKNAVDLVTSTNSDQGVSSSVAIRYVLPPSGEIALTNLQITGQSTHLTDEFKQDTVGNSPLYQELTYERIVDHEFHVYRNSIILEPKDSILVGWNFPLNPYQFITTTRTTVSSVTSYVADQTILHQEAASQLNTGKAIVDYRGGFQVGAVTGATQTRFALIQYIDPKTAVPYFDYFLSSLVKCAILTTHGTQVRLKIRLITQSGLPQPITATEPIASWPANSDPIFVGTWREIKPINDPEYIIQPPLTDSSAGTPFGTMSFNGFDPSQSGAFNDVLGIVVYTMDNLNSTSGSEDSIIFDKISLTQNYFAIETNSETYDESLRKCQFYYQKTFEDGVVPADNTGLIAGALAYRVSTGGTNLGGAIWYYPSVLRAAPISPDGEILSYNALGGGSNWVNFTRTATSGPAAPGGTSSESSYITNNPQVVGDLVTDYICVHLTADARLGLSF